MFTVMKVAGLIHAGGTGPGAEDLLRAAVQGGAAACGLAGIGGIVPGNRADLIVLDPAVHHDPARQAVYAEEWRPVRTAIVDGNVVVRDGRLTTVDEAVLLEEAQEASTRLVTRNASNYRFAEQIAPHMQRLVRRAKEVYASTHSGMRRSGSSNSTSA